MKRTTTALSAFAAGAALLLAGCGSDTSGTASPAAPSAASQASMTSEMSDTSSSEVATTDESSPEETSAEESSTGESSTDESTSDETSTADTSATTTVGSGGDLDETSIAWFDTYCTGVSPALDQVKNISSATSGTKDPNQMMKKLSTVFTAMGTAFTKTAKSLDGVPVPTFDGGDVLATNSLKAMKEFGPKFTELGTALAKGGADAASKLQSLGKDVQGLQELSRFKVDAGTLAAIKEIPSCKPLFSMGG